MDERKAEFKAGFFEWILCPALSTGYLIYEAPNHNNPVAALSTPEEVAQWIKAALRRYEHEMPIEPISADDGEAMPNVVRLPKTEPKKWWRK